MTDHELELRLKNTVEACTPDVLEKVMAECDNCKEKQRDKKKYGERSISDISGLSKKKSFRKFISMAAMFAVMVGIGIVGSSQYNKIQVVSIVQFDVNPSVEIQINKKEEVVKAAGINADGEKILSGMKLTGLDVYTATNALVGSLLKHGYIDELSNSILLSVEDGDSLRGSKLQEGLTGEMSAILKSASINASILSQYVDEEKVTQVSLESQQYGISHGKAALIEQILKSNEKYSFDELAVLSVNELNLIISNPKNQVQNVQTSGEAAKDAYIGEKNANQIAFAHAKVEESNVYNLEVEIDYEFGTMVYDVEFTSDNKEYEYFIDALNGEILEGNVEQED